jgi:alpha-glucosidase
MNRPEVHDLIREMRQVLDAYDNDRVSIGEVWFRPISLWVRYYGENLDEYHLPFNFGLLHQPWRADGMRALINEIEEALPSDAWPNNVLGNHDSPRLATRLGRDAVRPAAMMLLTLRGTPTIYMGEEIGMEDGHVPLNKIQDPLALNVSSQEGRDPCRTPFQWSADPYAGFSTVEPWLPVAQDYKTRNVANQKADPKSVFSLYRRLLSYRKETPALHQGTYRSIDNLPDGCFVYLREYDGERRLVAINFIEKPLVLALDTVAEEGQIALSTELDRSGIEKLSRLELRPHEGVIIEI